MGFSNLTVFFALCAESRNAGKPKDTYGLSFLLPASLLVENNRTAVVLGAQQLIRLVIDRFRLETNTAISKKEKRAASMDRLEPYFGIPVVGATAIEVDRNQGRTVAVAIVGCYPTVPTMF
jgi:hypothetical protein